MKLLNPAICKFRPIATAACSPPMNFKGSPSRGVKSISSPQGKRREESTFGKSSHGERLAVPAKSALPSTVLDHPSIMKVKERLADILPQAHPPSPSRIDTAQHASSRGISAKPKHHIVSSSSPPAATATATAAVRLAGTEAATIGVIKNENQSGVPSTFWRPVRKPDKVRKKSPEKFKIDTSIALETGGALLLKDETKAMSTPAPVFEGYEPEKMAVKRNSIVVDDENDPTNWTWVKDEDTQLYYYVNLRTMKSQWNKPKCLDNITEGSSKGFGSPGSPRDTKASALRASQIKSPSQTRHSRFSIRESSSLDDDPQNWTWQLDKETNLYYYINLTTRVSQWEKPGCLSQVSIQQKNIGLIPKRDITEFVITLVVVVFFGYSNIGPILVRRFILHFLAQFV